MCLKNIEALTKFSEKIGFVSHFSLFQSASHSTLTPTFLKARQLPSSQSIHLDALLYDAETAKRLDLRLDVYENNIESYILKVRDRPQVRTMEY